jgi:hypothetical protein
MNISILALNLCRPGGTRTLDPLIKSQLLCQLSYGPDFFSERKINYCRLK